jgi:hypothetical protein
MDTIPARASWRRILVEVSVIIGSILAAFAIDAVWESRSEAIQEEALLRALADDFEAAAGELERVTAAHGIVLSSTEQILHFSEADSVPDSSRALADTLVSNLFFRPSWDPPMGTIETLLGSGRLDLLRNPHLVAELTQWRETVASLQRNELDAERHFYDRIFPYLATRLSLKDVDKAIPRDVPWEQKPADAYRLILDPEFQNIVYMYWVLHWNVEKELPALEAALERVRSLTQAELGR